MTATQAAVHRRAMETAQVRLGLLHYRDKVHTALRSAYELAIHRHSSMSLSSAWDPTSCCTT
ncbi:MAG: hypothetical protein WBM50_01995 [Acidimicrobiales bacterium]